MNEVVVVTGIGGMGLASARRLGVGRALVVADIDPAKLAAETEHLAADGFDVTPVTVDVADRTSVEALASTARDRGSVRTVVHTAGLSPAQARAERLLAVDVMGTEYVLDAFANLVVPGTVAVCIASMAGYMAAIPEDIERELAAAPSEELLAILRRLDPVPEGLQYSLAKRVNQLRVERAAVAWGRRGGRVVSISPGIISTPMGRLELDGATDAIGGALAISPVPRIGTAEDIAAAVAWLSSSEASFVTGCDLRVDGGVTAAVSALTGANPLVPNGGT